VSVNLRQQDCEQRPALVQLLLFVYLLLAIVVEKAADVAKPGIFITKHTIG